jgi:hypothetical protein
MIPPASPLDAKAPVSPIWTAIQVRKNASYSEATLDLLTLIVSS